MRAPALRHIIVTSFISLIGFGIMIPLLPLYARHFGAGGMLVGLIMALNQLVDFLFAPVAGRWSDRIGRRPLLIGALLVTSASYLAVGLSPGMGVLLAVWALAGFGSSQILLTQAYIADVTDAATRTRGMGLWGAAFSVGFVIGPPVGARLFESHPLAASVLAALFALAAAVYAFFYLDEPPAHTIDEAAPRVSILRDLKPVVVTAIALYFIAIFVWSKLTNMLALFSRDEFGWQVREYGAYLGYIGLVAAVVQGGLIGRLSRRWGRRPLVTLGFLLLGAGLVMLVELPSTFARYGAATAIAIGFGLLMPTLPAILSLNVSPGNKGQALGIFQSASTLARVLAPLAAGLMYDRVSHGSPFLAGGIIALATALVTLPALRGMRRPRGV